MSLPKSLVRRLKLPLIVAPMFQISNPEMVIAACKAGAIGAFPTANSRTPEGLDQWLTEIRAGLSADDAPFAANLIMTNQNLVADLTCLVKHKTEIVITSVGSPKKVVQPLHDIGCLVYADVASVEHAKKAIAAGVDGLILLTAGAGGQTGWANGFSFVRAVREFFDGTVVLAGGVSDGAALWASEVLGCDLGYMGTPFIATTESPSSDGYKEMLINSTLDDVLLTKAFTGLETNMLRPSIVKAGIDLASLKESVSPAGVDVLAGKAAEPGAPRRWRDIWSAGHSVAGVHQVQSVGARVDTVRQQYLTARKTTLEKLA